MRRTIIYFFLLGLLALVFAQPLMAATKPQPKKSPSVDQRAVDTLRQMADYVRSQPCFSVHLAVTREVILQSNLQLDSDQAFDMLVRRPDHLAGDVESAAGERKFYYDGSTFTIYTPALKAYASVPAPPTIDGLFGELIKYGIEMPVADLIYSNPRGALLSNLVSAEYVGESLVDGLTTHQLAFQGKNADWQIWIQTGDMPTPVRLVITDKSQPGRPRYMVRFSDWDMTPTCDDSQFKFVPQPDDKKIEIRRMLPPKGKAGNAK